MARIKGAEIHIRRLKRMRDTQPIYSALFAGGDDIRTEAALSIVRGAVQGAGHVPSAPGEPPNRDTSQLDTSIITEGTPADLTVEVSANTEYAAALEFGSNDGRLEERPFMRPATTKRRPEVVRKVRRAAEKLSR